MKLNQILQILKGLKKELQHEYCVKRLGVFGSFVRGENTTASDLDILVDFDGAIDFFQFVELEQHLSDILGRQVDLVSKKSLKKYIGQQILSEVVYV